MSSMLEHVRAFLTAHELAAHPGGDGEALTVPTSLTHCQCNVLFHHDRETDILVVMGAVPVTVSSERRGAVAEFLTRLNWNLTGNRFLMDFEAGDVRVRRDVDVPEAPDRELIAGCFYSTCLALEQGEADYAKLTAKK